MTKRLTKEITEEQYIKAKRGDSSDIFSMREVCGYGIYNEQYYQEGDKYFVSYYMGSSCD